MSRGPPLDFCSIESEFSVIDCPIVDCVTSCGDSGVQHLGELVESAVEPHVSVRIDWEELAVHTYFVQGLQMPRW